METTRDYVCFRFYTALAAFRYADWTADVLRFCWQELLRDRDDVFARVNAPFFPGPDRRLDAEALEAILAGLAAHDVHYLEVYRRRPGESPARVFPLVLRIVPDFYGFFDAKQEAFRTYARSKLQRVKDSSAVGAYTERVELLISLSEYPQSALRPALDELVARFRALFDRFDILYGYISTEDWSILHREFSRCEELCEASRRWHDLFCPMEMDTSHGIQYGRTLKVSGIFWGNFLRAGHAAAFTGDPRRLSPVDWVVEELSEGRLFIHEPRHVCDARGEARGLEEVLERSLPERNRDAREQPPHWCATIISRDLLRRIGGAELLRASRAVRAVYPLGNGDVLAIWVRETYGTPWDLREALWPIWPMYQNAITWHETVIASKLGEAGQAVRCIQWVQDGVGKHKALFGLLDGALQEPVAAAIACHLVCTTALAEGKVEKARQLIADVASRALRFTAISSAVTVRILDGVAGERRTLLSWTIAARKRDDPAPLSVLEVLDDAWCCFRELQTAGQLPPFFVEVGEPSEDQLQFWGHRLLVNG